MCGKFLIKGENIRPVTTLLSFKVSVSVLLELSPLSFRVFAVPLLPLILTADWSFLLHFYFLSKYHQAIMNARPHKVIPLQITAFQHSDWQILFQQSMSELKLRRLTEHNQRLREDLQRPRVRVSEASARCVLIHVSFYLSIDVPCPV